MTDAEVVEVETVYEPAPVGAWRVAVRFEGGSATIDHTGTVAPKAGEVWVMRGPELAFRKRYLERRAPA